MITIHPIPAFDDNYIWLIHNGRHAAVIDPGDADPVEAYLSQQKLGLEAILLTHHHGDHCGGAAELAAHHHSPVFGPRQENIHAVTRPAGENDAITLPELGISLKVLDAPGHTRGHIAYYGINSLFCGDALFACGCGRLFEGTPEQMQASLAKFAALPDDTLVYCAHEYTLANLRFARIAEPGNPRLQERETAERLKRERGHPTLPSAIGLEKQTNPFLRWDSPEIIAGASRFAGSQLHTPAEIFGATRRWKDSLD